MHQKTSCKKLSQQITLGQVNNDFGEAIIPIIIYFGEAITHTRTSFFEYFEMFQFSNLFSI